MVIHDYPVPRKTLEQLESIADELRERLRVSEGFVDVFKMLFLDMPDYLKDRSLTLISRSAGYMGERDAYAVSKPNRIFYRPRLLAQLKMGVCKARVEFVHELAHILLHPGAEKAWIATGNKTKSFIPQEESAEWQATTLSLCILAPRRLAETYSSASKLADDFGLDIEHAEKRFDQIVLRRRKNVPSIYHDVRRQLVSCPEPQPFLNEQCTSCGERALIKLDCKYRCAGCGRVSDIFQDGDLVT